MKKVEKTKQKKGKLHKIDPNLRFDQKGGRFVSFQEELSIAINQGKTPHFNGVRIA